MSLRHALLTALLERPGSGLELATRFNKSIGHFWAATHQQIYRELSRLDQSGLIASTPDPEARGRKRIYRILPAGRETLRQWVPADDPPSVIRDAMLVRLRAEAVIGPTELAQSVRSRLAGHEKKLAQYQAVEATDFIDADSNRTAALRHLVLIAGIRHEQNWIETLNQALDILDRDGDKKTSS